MSAQWERGLLGLAGLFGLTGLFLLTGLFGLFGLRGEGAVGLPTCVFVDLAVAFCCFVVVAFLAVADFLAFGVASFAVSAGFVVASDDGWTGVCGDGAVRQL
jgi:hypothetical protein